MRDSLKPGIEYELRFRVPESKTVPWLYPEAPEFQAAHGLESGNQLLRLWHCPAAGPRSNLPRHARRHTNRN